MSSCARLERYAKDCVVVQLALRHRMHLRERSWYRLAGNSFRPMRLAGGYSRSESLAVLSIRMRKARSQVVLYRLATIWAHFGGIVMRRIRAFLITLIILAVAVRIVWAAIAPLVPEAIIGLVAISVLSLVYHRKRLW